MKTDKEKQTFTILKLYFTPLLLKSNYVIDLFDFINVKGEHLECKQFDGHNYLQERVKTNCYYLFCLLGPGLLIDILIFD